MKCAVKYPVGWCLESIRSGGEVTGWRAHVFMHVCYCIVCVQLDMVDMLCSLLKCAGGVFRGDVQRFGARCS